MDLPSINNWEKIFNESKIFLYKLHFGKFNLFTQNCQTPLLWIYHQRSSVPSTIPGMSPLPLLLTKYLPISSQSSISIPPWKRQKNPGFLTFSREIEKQNWRALRYVHYSYSYWDFFYCWPLSTPTHSEVSMKQSDASPKSSKLFYTHRTVTSEKFLFPCY